MPECKTVECCDLDDFPEGSSSDGNCPVGWYWNGSACARCEIPPAPSALPTISGIELEWDVAEGLRYRIERMEQGDTMWTIFGIGTGSDTHEFNTDTTVVAGNTYYYRIVVEQSEECGYIDGESVSVVAI